MNYNFRDNNEDKDFISYIGDNGGFDAVNSYTLKGFTFTKFTLDELGLPPYKEILKAVLSIKEEVGLQGWRSEGRVRDHYKGFSLTYNPDFVDTTESIYHQTWGSDSLKQVYGRELGTVGKIRNTYYDSYGFRIVPPIVEKNLGFLIDRFNCPLIRSRAAFYNMYGKQPRPDGGWHVDEPPYHLFRVVIPLQTSEEYIIQIKGEDEYGNKEDLVEHLIPGNLYLWNTRIPHRPGTTTVVKNKQDRINLVLGLSPWYIYDKNSDCYIKSPLYGKPLKEIIENKMFLTSY